MIKSDFYRWSLFIFFFITTNLEAILDGRVSPIVLDARYTFTNYEFARGFVSLRGGFDVPPHGTIILQLEADCPVNDSIGLNNGTIIINNELTLGSDTQITGSGYLFGKAIASSRPTLYFQNLLTFKGSYIKIIDTLTFQSRGWGVIDFLYNAVLDAREATFLGFTNCDVVDRGTSILTTVNMPQNFVFSDCRIFAGLQQITSWLCPSIYFQGENDLVIGTKLSMNMLTLVSNGQIYIGSGSALQLTSIDFKSHETRAFINNSSLDFVSTVTGAIDINASSSQQGKLVITGRTALSSSTNNMLRISPMLKVEILPAALLTLSETTHIIVE